MARTHRDYFFYTCPSCSKEFSIKKENAPKTKFKLTCDKCNSSTICFIKDDKLFTQEDMATSSSDLEPNNPLLSTGSNTTSSKPTNQETCAKCGSILRPGENCPKCSKEDISIKATSTTPDHSGAQSNSRTDNEETQNKQDEIHVPPLYFFRNFKEMHWIFVLIFNILSLGFYNALWYRKIKYEIGELDEFNVTNSKNFGGLFTGYAILLMTHFVNTPWWLPGVISLSILCTFSTLSYKFKNILEEYAAVHKIEKFETSGIMAILFWNIYLQYKINELIFIEAKIAQKITMKYGHAALAKAELHKPSKSTISIENDSFFKDPFIQKCVGIIGIIIFVVFLIYLDNFALKKPVHSSPNIQKVQKTIRKKPSSTLDLIFNVVKISTNSGIGAGFFVSPNLIVTNKHVVGSYKTVFVKLCTDGENAKPAVGKVIKVHPNKDLALLYVSRSSQYYVDFSRIGAYILGETVTAIGHPQGLEFTVTKGVVSGFRKDGYGTQYIQTDTAISPGNSGGPLFYNGKVVGINTRKWASINIDNISFAISSDDILDFID